MRQLGKWEKKEETQEVGKKREVERERINQITGRKITETCCAS